MASGLIHTEAYLKAGFKTTKQAARGNAARMIANDSLKNRFKELGKSMPDILTACMTIEEKLTVLAKIIRKPFNSQEVKINDILRAIELHSIMMSNLEPVRTELQVGSSTLQRIKERVQEVGYTLSRRYSHKTEVS